MYFAPFGEDLHQLWCNRVDSYDAFSKTLFKLNAILLQMTNDFSTYGNLVGCHMKGKMLAYYVASIRKSLVES